MVVFVSRKKGQAMAKRQLKIKEIIFRSVACDYLSLTTYSWEIYKQWEEVLRRMELGEPTAKAYSQYKGFMWGDDIELMRGDQAEGMHYMLVVKGANADVCLRHMVAWGLGIYGDIKCTIFDVQITLPPLPQRPRLREIVTMWEDGAFSPFIGKGKPEVWGWMKNGIDTMYIGSKSSDVFARIYDKPIAIVNNAPVLGERYEVSFREKRSNTLFQRVISNPLAFSDKPMRDALLGHIRRLPPEMAVFLAAAQKEAVVGDPWIVERTAKGEPNGYQWLMMCKPAIQRVAAEKGVHGENIRRMLIEAFIEAVNGGDIQNAGEWAIVAPNGRVYNPAGILYNVNTGDGGIVIQNVRRSTITIGDMTGRDSVKIETLPADNEAHKEGD